MTSAGVIHVQVLALWWSGADLHALVRILPTATGQLVLQLYKAGGAVGGSCRGWATLLPADASGSARHQLVAADYELLA